MRLPMRRRLLTRLPSTALIGGAAVRSRNGLRMRTRSQRLADDALVERFDVDDDVGQLGHG